MQRRTAEMELDPRADASGPIRAVYAWASDPEGSFGHAQLVEEIRAELRRIPAETSDAQHLDELQRLAADWSAEEARTHLALLDRVRGDEDRSVLVRRTALGCAPLAMVFGGWLQWLSAPGNADSPLRMRVLALFASDIGVGQPRASRGSAYLALLRHLALSEHAVPTARLALDRRIADRAFHVPALLLAMSRRPDDFLPEILGDDLCLRTVGLLPALTIVKQLLPAAADWVAIDPGSRRQDGLPPALEGSGTAVATLVAEALADEAERATLGFGWALAALRRWSSDLHAELDASRDPAFEMAELLRLRAREGTIYHKTFKLARRPLSEWLREACTDPSGMLRALAASRLVTPGQPDASPLVTSLVDENGPMFRVFAPENLAVIRRWIDSLPANGAVTEPPAAIAAESPPFLLRSLDPVPARPDEAPSTLREAYHRLLRRNDTPALRRFALEYVRRWLARSRYGIDRAEHQLPERWGSGGLRPWLAEQHDRHDREFKDTSEIPVPPREEVIDSTVQLAPLTLIDGAWLQGFTDHEHASSETGYFLFETYWDELGNGEPQLNHPLIYRQVLAEMDIVLPPTASREFIDWPGFRDSSFELPLYWLSVGRFPRTLMPEILGLNLAMELSGVGGTYRRARIALKAHGFSTKFVDIHNTIDNVAAGHSAWAADAIDSYMSSLPVAQGAAAQTQAWDRVRVGYRSLNPPTGFLARRAARRA